jgi:hypothetical protein
VSACEFFPLVFNILEVDQMAIIGEFNVSQILRLESLTLSSSMGKRWEERDRLSWLTRILGAPLPQGFTSASLSPIPHELPPLPSHTVVALALELQRALERRMEESVCAVCASGDFSRVG